MQAAGVYASPRGGSRRRQPRRERSRARTPMWASRLDSLVARRRMVRRVYVTRAHASKLHVSRRGPSAPSRKTVDASVDGDSRPSQARPSDGFVRQGREGEAGGEAERPALRLRRGPGGRLSPLSFRGKPHPFRVMPEGCRPPENGLVRRVQGRGLICKEAASPRNSFPVIGPTAGRRGGPRPWGSELGTATGGET